MKQQPKKRTNRLMLWVIISAIGIFVLAKFLIYIVLAGIAAVCIFVLLYMTRPKFHARVNNKVNNIVIRLKLKKAKKEEVE